MVSFEIIPIIMLIIYKKISIYGIINRNGGMYNDLF